MKIFSTLIIALLIIFQTVGFAASETFSASGEYLMSDYDTPEIAEEIALDFAKQNAAEQAGIYLESYSRSIDSEVDELEIKTVASSKVEVLDKNITRQNQAGGRILLRANIRAAVDTSELDNFLAQTRQERQQAIQRYKALQEMNNKIKQDIDEFQSKLTAIKDEVKDDDLIVEQERINREFLAKQKSEEFSDELGASKDFSFNINHLEEAIKLQPKLSWLYMEYAVFKSIGKVGDIEAAILADPNNAHNVVSSMAPDIKEINKAIILSPNESSLYGMRAVHYATNGAGKKLAGENAEAKRYFDKALADYNKAVQLEPKNAWSYINRGNFYRDNLEDYDKALADFTKAINLDPKNGYAYKDRGDLYKELKKYPESIKDYEVAMKIDPKNFDGFDYIKMGDFYKETKDYPRALEYYTKTIELDAEFAFADHRISAYNSRAELYLEMGENDKAIADCDKGIELATEAGDKLWVGLIKMTKNDALEAKEQQDKFGNIDTKDPEALVKRAQEYFRTGFKHEGHYERAVEDYMLAISIDPKILTRDEKILVTYIAFLDDYKVQLGYLNKLLKLNPKSSAFYNSRGWAYENLGDLKKALADYNKALELNPDSDVAKNNRQRVLDSMKK